MFKEAGDIQCDVHCAKFVQELCKPCPAPLILRHLSAPNHEPRKLSMWVEVAGWGRVAQALIFLVGFGSHNGR